MFYTIKQLIRKFKKCKTCIRVCLDRYGIKRVVLPKTKQVVYDIPNDKMEKIKQFVTYRKDVE